MSTTGSRFIWYELMTTDADAAARFYGAVVGWTIAGRPDPAAGGKDYRMIGRADGGAAGGVLQLTPDDQTQGARPAWVGYLQVSDVDAAVQSITADGGRALMPAMSLPVGRIAMVTDQAGAPFYVMAPVPPPDRPDAVSDVFSMDRPQHVRWNEWVGTDVPRAQAFYARHFGFRFDDAMSMGPDLGDYHFIDDGALRIGGLMQAAFPGMPVGWTFYIGVPSATAAAQAIVAAGGRIEMDLRPVPGDEWVAVATDPQGARFGIVGPK